MLIQGQYKDDKTLQNDWYRAYEEITDAIHLYAAWITYTKKA